MTTMDARWLKKNSAHFDLNSADELRAAIGPHSSEIAQAGDYIQGSSWVISDGAFYKLNTDAVLQAARGNTDTVDQTVLPSAGDGGGSADWIAASIVKPDYEAAETDAAGILNKKPFDLYVGALDPASDTLPAAHSGYYFTAATDGTIDGLAVLASAGYRCSVNGTAAGDSANWSRSREHDLDRVTLTDRYWKIPAINPNDYTVVMLINNGGRSGEFVWTEGDYSDEITADTTQGIYIKANGFASSFGAWVRRSSSAVYNVEFWGALGNNGDDTVSIQAAFDTVPVGSVLMFQKGSYRCTGVFQRRGFSIKGPSQLGATLYTNITDASDVTTDILTIEITENDGSVDIRGYEWSNMRMFHSGAGGRHAIKINAPDTGLPMSENVIQMCSLNGKLDNSGRAIYVEGVKFAFNNFLYNTLSEGVVLDGCADGNRFYGNKASGKQAGIELDLVFGAYQTLILSNVLVSRDGGVRIVNGSQIVIDKNHFEHGESDANQSVESAHVVILGESYPSEACKITNSNMGAGTNIERSVYIGNAKSTLIDANDFNISAMEDVKTTPDAIDTMIGDSNVYRGRAATQYPLVATDDGQGTSGVVKQLVSHQNNWTGGDFIKRMDGTVQFITAFNAGSLVANSVMATMPAGFESADFYEICCGTTGGAGVISMRTNGEVWARSLPANGSVGACSSYIAVKS